MSEIHVVPVPEAVRDRCFINEDQYKALYERSIEDPEGFWAEQADIFVDWFEKWTEISDANLFNAIQRAMDATGWALADLLMRQQSSLLRRQFEIIEAQHLPPKPAVYAASERVA